MGYNHNVGLTEYYLNLLSYIYFEFIGTQVLQGIMEETYGFRTKRRTILAVLQSLDLGLKSKDHHHCVI